MAPVSSKHLTFCPGLYRTLARALVIDFDRARALVSVLDDAHGRVLAPALGSALARALARDLTPAFARRWGLEPDPDLVPDPDLARAVDLARVLDPALALVGVVDDAGSHLVDLALARDLARNLNSSYVGAMSRSLGLDRIEGLAAALLNGALDDFTQADLSHGDLAGVDLTGVRWSMRTQWPSDVDRDAVLGRSRETTPRIGDLCDRVSAWPEERSPRGYAYVSGTA